MYLEITLLLFPCKKVYSSEMLWKKWSQIRWMPRLCRFLILFYSSNAAQMTRVDACLWGQGTAATSRDGDSVTTCWNPGFGCGDDHASVTWYVKSSICVISCDSHKLRLEWSPLTPYLKWRNGSIGEWSHLHRWDGWQLAEPGLTPGLSCIMVLNDLMCSCPQRWKCG